MFKHITEQLAKDPDYPERQFKIKVLSSVIDGTMYDHLDCGFHEETDATGEYIPLRSRRPCVKYNISSIIVSDSVALLFSEGHFPEVVCDHEPTKEALALLVKEVKLNMVMIDAATRGSVGSVAILMRVLSNRVFLDILSTQFLTPTWKPEEPDVLELVTEQYKIKGAALKAVGYPISDDDLNVDFWWKVEWTETQEIYYTPVKVSDLKENRAKWEIDAAKTTTHAMGFVPIVWIKNLPGGDDIDGGCTFKEAIETQIEMEYLLSQGGRGLKYSCDPTLMLKEPAAGDGGSMIKGAGNALVVGQEGDAKLLEINGTAAQAVIEYVKALREAALESCHGNRTDANKLAAATSGRAMELMNQALIWLADQLRITYGEGAILELMNMIVQASKKFKLVTKKGKPIGDLDCECDLSLRWPDWYAPTYEDKSSQATALKIHTDAGHLSTETATKTIAAVYDIEDAVQETGKIAKERQERLAEQTKLMETKSKGKEGGET